MQKGFAKAGRLVTLVGVVLELGFRQSRKIIQNKYIIITVLREKLNYFYQKMAVHFFHDTTMHMLLVDINREEKEN